MKKILIVGATGQLGTKIVEKLHKQGTYLLRLLIREDSQYGHLKDKGAEFAFGDLKDPVSIEKALEGCHIVISTANAAAPRKKEDSFQEVDIEGYQSLIALAKAKGVEQFIFTSALPPEKRFEKWIPLCKAKLATERYLKNSGLTYTIFQPDTYMDVYFAFFGTTIPVKGEPAALVNRPFKFMQSFYKRIKNDIEKGKFGIIGDGTSVHHYIAIENVADFIVASAGNPELYNQTVKIGGPEGLSSLQVKELFEKLLGTPLEIKRTPAIMMRLMGNAFQLYDEGAANILKLNYMAATSSSDLDTKPWADKLGIRLITAEEYLNSKMGTVEVMKEEEEKVEA